MYIEKKGGSIPGQSRLLGLARIGRVTFSKTGKSVYYAGKTLRRFQGYKANHYDIETGDHYWISGPRQDGEDGLYGYRPTPIDPDVREENWTSIRKCPDRIHENVT